MGHVLWCEMCFLLAESSIKKTCSAESLYSFSVLIKLHNSVLLDANECEI